MKALRPDHLAHIEQILGEPLSPDLRVEVANTEALSPAAFDVVRRIAKTSNQLAFMYLREMVPSERIGPLMVFLEGVIEGS